MRWRKAVGQDISFLRELAGLSGAGKPEASSSPALLEKHCHWKRPKLTTPHSLGRHTTITRLVFSRPRHGRLQLLGRARGASQPDEPPHERGIVEREGMLARRSAALARDSPGYIPRLGNEAHELIHSLSGTTASARSSFEAPSARRLVSSFPSSCSSEERGRSGRDWALVQGGRGRSVTA